MLADVAALGLRGVEIGSNVAGVPLHDRRFAAFFAEAERLELTVFVHAFHPHGFDTITGGPAASGVGLTLPRMDRMWDFDPGFRERMPERPSDLARRVFVDLLVFAPWALRFVLEVLGADRVVVGSDYPFMPDAPGAVLEHLTDLTSEDLERITVGNARALLGDDHLRAARAEGE
jgi:aminocarboxymuconate-semialdehyde decarboxylase